MMVGFLDGGIQKKFRARVRARVCGRDVAIPRERNYLSLCLNVLIGLLVITLHHEGCLDMLRGQDAFGHISRGCQGHQAERT